MIDNILLLFIFVVDVFVVVQYQIIVILVIDENCISFWLQYFGSILQWIIFELIIFVWMDCFCMDYSGGIWNFYMLSNGGVFMVLEVENDEFWLLFNMMNGNGGDMSVEVVGIVVCLMVFSYYVCCIECDVMMEYYYCLWDYVFNYVECNVIMYIID